MQVNRNELTVYRGESFTLDKTIEYPDGAPFIISNALENPYILISVSDSAYSKDKRYVLNHWLNLESVPKFSRTRPRDLQDIKTSAEGTESLYKSFSEVSFPITGDNPCYIDGKFVQYMPATYTVWYNSLEPEEGYKYWDEIENSWKTYLLHIVDGFTSYETKQWSAQKYYYTIQLVTGGKVRPYLLNLVDEHLTSLSTSVGDMSDLEIYNELKKVYAFPVNFDATQPIASIDESTPILPPTLIKVISYMQGDL